MTGKMAIYVIFFYNEKMESIFVEHNMVQSKSRDETDYD